MAASESALYLLKDKVFVSWRGVCFFMHRDARENIREGENGWCRAVDTRAPPFSFFSYSSERDAYFLDLAQRRTPCTPSQSAWQLGGAGEHSCCGVMRPCQIVRCAMRNPTVL